MKSNVTLYIDAGALLRGSTRSADYPPVPTTAGGRALRALILFDRDRECRFGGARRHRHGGLPGVMARLPTDTSDGDAREIRTERYWIRMELESRATWSITAATFSFRDLLLLRSAY